MTNRMIKLVYLYSANKLMHGPINLREVLNILNMAYTLRFFLFKMQFVS